MKKAILKPVLALISVLSGIALFTFSYWLILAFIGSFGSLCYIVDNE